MTIARSKTWMLLGLVAALTACGGGGGGGAATAPAAPADSGGTFASPGAPVAPAVEGEVVVMVRSGADIGAVAQSFGLQVVDQFGRRPIYRLRLPAGANVDATVAALKADARVLEAEANEQAEAPESRRARSGGGGGAWSIGGDAGTFASQWAPAALQLDRAHAVSRGDAIRVAVLDTGIDLAHPGLAARFARDGAGAVLGRDLVDDDALPNEEGSRATSLAFGHGTHVAGLVALAAPQAQLMPVRVLDPSGVGNVWVLSEGLLWAVDPDGNPATDDGAHVVNLSLGTTRSTNVLRRAIALASCDFDDDDDDDDYSDTGYDDDRVRCAARHGAAVMAAVGNGGSASERQYPAAEESPGSLALAASTQSRRLATFSNRGDWVEAAAPGDSIISTVPGGGYGVWSGTSMAAPLAAGSAALLMATLPPSGNPALPTPRQWLAADVVKRLSDRTAKLCGDTSLRQIDAYAALTDTSAPDPDCP